MNFNRRLLYITVVIVGLALVGSQACSRKLKKADENKNRDVEQKQMIAALEQRIKEGEEALEKLRFDGARRAADLTQKHKQLLVQLHQAHEDKVKLDEIIKGHQDQVLKSQNQIAELKKVNQSLRERNKRLVTGISEAKAYCQELVAGKTELTKQVNLCWQQRVPCFASLPWDTCGEKEGK